MDVVRGILAVVIAYLLGSVSFAYIITKIKTGKDIRTIGSGSAGTTNTARAVGKPLAMVVMALDIFKGWLAAELGLLLFGLTGGLLAFAAVILGHIFPVWLNFKGGKGVACGAGACLAISPAPILLAAAMFAVVIAVSGYVSLGSIVGCVALMISVLVLPEPTIMRILYVVMAGTVILMHRANIKRLINGTESKTFHKK